MSASEKAAKARARMEQVRREMTERRAMRVRNGRAIQDKARESLLRQGPVAAQVAKHMGELGRRHRAAGGWATEKTERDKDYILGIGADEDEQKPAFAYRSAPRPQGGQAPGGIGAIEDEEVEVEQPPPTPPAPEAPAARHVRRPAPASFDDEDDYSNQSSWMRNQ
ncbi:MAG: hypothetical protein ACRDSK_15355 [Actinophytocola sp.]|uniref:hypothetical protein n=1 Tax=Actinophytocola sp. TaxID=1872138 RepID=UPI003D6A14EA